MSSIEIISLQGGRSGGGGGGGAVLTHDVILNDAQIKNLPTVGSVIIVPAAGAGKIIFPLVVYLRLKWFANYGNIDPGGVIAFRGADTNTYIGTLTGNGNPPGTGYADILAPGGDEDAIITVNTIFGTFHDGTPGETWGSLTGNFNSGGPQTPNVDYLMLVFQGGNFTGGDARNRLLIHTIYSVIDISSL